MSPPLLSICIPTFNRGWLLKDLLECLERELRGKDGLVEVIVSDNCSDDDTQEVVDSYRNKIDLKYFKNERNEGASANIFNVPSRSSGDYCWIIGDDDLIVPGAIDTVLDVVGENSGTDCIVVGYSYENASQRDTIKLESGPVTFRSPVFSGERVSKILERWEDTFYYSDIAGLHTAIVSCIFRRTLWLAELRCAQDWQLEPVLTTLESTFPFTLIWARMFVGKPVYFISRPLVYFFVGEQEWFQSKWGTIVFSFCLELAQFFRRIGASSQAVQHYEDSILKLHNILRCLIEQPNEYAKKHFSLSWLLNCYGNNPLLWTGLGRAIKRSKGFSKVSLLRKICTCVLDKPRHWPAFFRLVVKTFPL